MKQNLIISIVIVVAVCLVVIFFAVGYSRMLQPVSNPVPVTTAAHAAGYYSGHDHHYSDTGTHPHPDGLGDKHSERYDQYRQRKTSVIQGRAYMDPGLAVQGQYVDVINTLYKAQTNFTTAKQYLHLHSPILPVQQRQHPSPSRIRSRNWHQVQFGFIEHGSLYPVHKPWPFQRLVEYE